MVKKGDTLIEVLLAVGIFSMIAISVVAVMSGGTSSAQTALETTLAREEIDAQAEALRYIHDSYINDKNSDKSDLSTVALWRKIINQDNVYVPSGDKDDEELLKYNPTTCPTSASELPANAFILDTRALNLLGAAAYKSVKDDANVFAPATTFPRLIFGAGSENSLIEGDTSTALSRAEGIYIIAVADRDTTTVLGIDGEKVQTDSPAFFDFYIRTCWYGTDAETPSTISTVIRLHNPDVQTQYYSYSHSIRDEYGNIISSDGARYQPTTLENRTQSIKQPGWDFVGWCYGGNKITKPGDPCTGTIFKDTKFYNIDPPQSSYDFYPVWSQVQYTITYESNGSSWTRADQICTVDWGKNTNDCYIAADDITRSGYKFEGWCDGEVDTRTGSCSGNKYAKGQNIKAPFPNSRVIHLKAIWRENNEAITIKLTWNTSIDYDSYIVGTKSSGEAFTAYYGNKKPTETVSGVTRTLAELDHDCTSWQADYCKPSRNETFTINTLGGRNYYYYVRNFTNSDNITGATVVVSGPYIGTYTYNANNASGNGRVWNVFAYKDGKIVNPGGSGKTTRSSEANTKY